MSEFFQIFLYLFYIDISKNVEQKNRFEIFKWLKIKYFFFIYYEDVKSYWTTH
jgi:hypothetical protein